MTRLPGVRWSLAGLIAVLLFMVPVVNGVVAGAYGAWHEPRPAKAAAHALATALVLFCLLWMMELYGAVWHPFAPFNATLRSAFSALALFVTAMAVTVVKTTHKSPAV